MQSRVISHQVCGVWYVWCVELMANISLNSYRLPNTEDFNGAVSAIQRLQATYQLSASNLSSGNLGKTPSLTMTGMYIGTCRQLCTCL